MQPGDRYEMNWSTTTRRSVLCVDRVHNDDIVYMRKWIKKRRAWTKYSMPMQMLTVSSGRKLSADEPNPS
jgi:hypothetical protein